MSTIFLDVEGNKGIGMQLEHRGFVDNIVGNIIPVAKRCNYPGRSRVTRLVSYNLFVYLKTKNKIHTSVKALFLVFP